MIMIGAMLQMLPVMVGSPVKNPRPVSTVIHITLCIGLVALIGGFLSQLTVLFYIAIPLLGISFTVFIVTAAISMAKAPTINASVIGMRLAIGSLAITVILAITVATDYALQGSMDKSWTNAHLTWGLIGWVYLLLISVAYEVVPMFQMTPAYPKWMTRWLTKLLFISLLLWSFLCLLPSSIMIMTDILSLIIAIMIAIFSICTLYLQQKRRRKVADVSLYYWRVSMLSLLLSSTLWIISRFWQPLYDWSSFELMLGTLMIIGVVISANNAMLYKIVPFLVWFHSQSLRSGHTQLPNMHEIIPDSGKRRQLYLHCMAFIILIGAITWSPNLVWLAAILFSLSFMYIWYDLYSAYRLYLAIKKSHSAE
jgi:hypothetical protein